MKKKPRKRKGGLPISCSYCVMFCTAKDRKINADEDNLAFSRYCIIIDERIIGGTKACSSFVPYKYFWCDKQNYWIHKEACMNRKICKKRLAKNCKQQHLIKRINYE